MRPLPILLALAATIPMSRAIAQSGDQRAAVLAVVDSALAAVSRADQAAFADLMIPEAVVMPTQAGQYFVLTREEIRAQKFPPFIERGFDPVVQMSGPLASVWLPYDLYIDGKWSHCGVDQFTLLWTGETWRIAFMSWTIEQPPACRRHPDGPPN